MAKKIILIGSLRYSWEKNEEKFVQKFEDQSSCETERT